MFDFAQHVYSLTYHLFATKFLKFYRQSWIRLHFISEKFDVIYILCNDIHVVILHYHQACSGLCCEHIEIMTLADNW